MTKLKSFLFQNKSTGQTIAKNTFWLSTNQIFGRLIKAGLMIYAARVLGTAGYGVFSYALSIAVLFSIIADMGVGALLTRNLSVNEKMQKSLIATSLVIKLSLILMSVLAIIFVAPLFTRITDAIALLPIIAILVIFDAIREFVMSINRATQRMELEAGIHILTNIFIVIGGIAALFLFKTSQALFVAYTIGSGLGLLVALIVLGKHLSKIWRAFDKSLVRKIIQESWPFALLGLLGVVMVNTDIVMLGFFREASEVGLYSAAQRPISILYSIPGIMAGAYLPAITKLVNKDDKRIRGLLEKTITATLLIGFPLMLGGITVGPALIGLIFGASYSGAVLSFQVLLSTILIVFPSMIISTTVFAYNRQRSFIGLLLLGTIGNIVFNYFLIPKYGINGSAFATVGAELIANIFIWSKMKKINHFTILPHLKKIIPAALIMMALTVFMQSVGVGLLLNIALSGIVYFVLLRAFKEPLLKTAKELISVST